MTVFRHRDPHVGYPAQRHWAGRWIWTGEAGRQKNVFRYFRRKFELDAPAAILLISADSHYVLTLDGERIGQGPPPSSPHFKYFDRYDLADRLATGPHCLGVLVNHIGDHPDARCGLLAELLDADGRVVLTTDESWRWAPAEAYQSETYFIGNKVSPHQEDFDARRVPTGWDRVGFDDADWQPARVIVGRISDRPPAVVPWTTLVERDIPFMATEFRPPVEVTYTEECLDLAKRRQRVNLAPRLSIGGRPISASRLEGVEALCDGSGPAVAQCSPIDPTREVDGVHDPCVVLDFGRVITAWPVLQIDAPGGGAVEVGYVERLIDGRFNNTLEVELADRFAFVPGEGTYRPVHWKAFRYLKLRFTGCRQPVTIRSLRAEVTSYPFDERGRFTSDDETLNAVFDICRYTLRLGTVESIMDPWREKAQWLGDVSAVTIGGLYACFGETRLPGKFFRQSAVRAQQTGLMANVSNGGSGGWPSAIPDYSLWWVQALWNHYLYTGQAAWVSDYYPDAARILRTNRSYTSDDGLIADMPFWVFIDWANVDRRGICAAYNAIYYETLAAGARLAEVVGDATTAQTCQDIRAAMEKSFAAALWDERRGAFADARIDDDLSAKTSEHANLAAIAFGLADEAQTARIIAGFYEDRSVEFTLAEPFFTSVVLRGLVRAGRFDLAMRIIRQRWGRWMVAHGATSTSEEWGMNGSWRSGDYVGFQRTLSHAWSAFPAEFLIRYVIGLEIVTPGATAIRLEPRDIGLDYEIVYPLLAGDVHVLRRGPTIHVDLPDGVQRVD